MALAPLYSGGSGNPTKVRRSIAPQSLGPGYPATSGYVDFLHNGGGGAPAPDVVPAQKISGSIEREPDLPGKTAFPTEPLAFGDHDPEDLAQIYAISSVHEKFATSNPGSSTAYLHRIGASKASTQKTHFSQLMDETYGQIIRVSDIVFAGYTLAAGPNGNCNLVAPWMAGPYDYHGSPSQTVGTGGTAPILKYTWDGNHDLDTAADSDIYGEVVTALSGGAVVMKWKKGSSGTYGANVSIPVDVETVIYYNDGTRDVPFGGEQEAVKALIPTSIASTLDVGDIFRYTRRRTAASQVLATSYAIPEVNCKAYLGSDEIPIEGGWSFTAAIVNPGVIRRENTGGQQPLGVVRRGHLQYEFAIDREFVDLALQRPLLRRVPVAFGITMFTNIYIGSTAYRYGSFLAMPYNRIRGEGFSVKQGGGNTRQQLVLEPKRPPSGSEMSFQGLTISDAVEWGIYNDIATIN